MKYLHFLFQLRNSKGVVTPKDKNAVIFFKTTSKSVSLSLSVSLTHGLSHTMFPLFSFSSQMHSVSVVMVTVFSSLIMLRVCPIKWCRHRGPLNLPDIRKQPHEQETQHLHDKWLLLITHTHTCADRCHHTNSSECFCMWHIQPDQRWHNEICMSRGLVVCSGVFWGR